MINHNLRTIAKVTAAAEANARLYAALETRN